MDKWFEDNYQSILDDYFKLLKFKTISASKDSLNEMIKCSNWISNYLKNIGFLSEIIKTSSFPIVYAEKIINKNFPTVLIYGHYDVQPIDPIEEWKNPPFEPKIENDIVFARGASDNKGQIAYVLSSLKALEELKKEIKVNIKLCLEGEEESNSRGLHKCLDEIKNKIKADYLLVVDFGIPNRNTPAITLGARGICALSVEFIGSNIDLHSGEHGGIAYNPLKAACEVLSKLVDKDGRICIDRFYDDVLKIDDKTKKNLDLDFDEEDYKKSFGIKNLATEKGYSPLESNWLRPTIEINGIGGGYFQKGFKTVIPAKVCAKISSRLVLNQRPEEIGKLIKYFLEKNTPKEIDIKVEYEDGGMPLRADGTSLLAKACAKAYEEVFGKPCKRILAGGSVPIIGAIVNKLNCKTVMMGTALLSDNIHAPNEHFDMDRFKKGFLTVARILQILETE